MTTLFLKQCKHGYQPIIVDTGDCVSLVCHCGEEILKDTNPDKQRGIESLTVSWNWHDHASGTDFKTSLPTFDCCVNLGKKILPRNSF